MSPDLEKRVKHLLSSLAHEWGHLDNTTYTQRACSDARNLLREIEMEVKPVITLHTCDMCGEGTDDAETKCYHCGHDTARVDLDETDIANGLEPCGCDGCSECQTCGGSGGGEGYYSCPACMGFGLRRR